MEDIDFLEKFINKRVSFRYRGQDLEFDLSQSLFSSNDVDDSTRLLLTSVTERVDLSQVHSLLDIGSGVGVIGICLKKINPAISAVFQDRDALAAAFTRRNAQLNQLGEVEVTGSLALDQLADRRFDLILSNLPGKAGPAVLGDVLRRIPQILTEGGQAFVVISKPLSEMVEETLIENGSDIVHKASRGGSTVFHFKNGAAPDETSPLLTPYTRGNYPFKMGKKVVELATVHDLPEFDTIGYHTALAVNMIRNEKLSGRLLFWNPGQGHLPVFAAQNSGEAAAQWTLAGRDLLSLLISQQNLTDQGVAPETISLAHLPHILEMQGQFDTIAAVPDFDPGVPWESHLLPAFASLLVPGGRLLLTARSAFMHRVLLHSQAFNAVVSKKRHGFRSLLLQRKASS